METVDNEDALMYARSAARRVAESIEVGREISQAGADLERLLQQHNQAIARYRQLRDQLSGS